MLADFVSGARGANRVTSRDILAILETAVQRACQRIHQEAQADTAKRGMGTTLSRDRGAREEEAPRRARAHDPDVGSPSEGMRGRPERSAARDEQREAVVRVKVGERPQHALQVDGDAAPRIQVTRVDAYPHAALREDARPWRRC